jgi:hypothetical protein
MTLISRLLGKGPESSPAAGHDIRANVAEHGDDAAQRASRVSTLEFGDALLSTAFGSDSADQHAARKRIAELVDAKAVSVEQLPAGMDKRAALLATLAWCSGTDAFDVAAAGVTDQALWLELATAGESAKLRYLAAQRVEGEDRLRILIRAARDSDKNVYRVAKTKLDEIHAIAKREEETRAHILSIGETIERHSYKPFDNAYVATLEHLVGEWSGASVDVPEETRQRVSAAIDRARDSITNHIRAAGAQAARESAIANAEPLRLNTLDELQKILLALYSATTFSATEGASVTDRLKKLQERWNDTLHYKAASAEQQKSFEQLHRAVRKLSASIASDGTVQQRIEAAAASPSDQAYARIEAVVADAALLAEQDRPAVAAAAQEAAKHWREQRAQQRASIADAERQLANLIRRAQQTLASGQSRPALGIRRSIEAKLGHLPSVPKHIAERLQQLDDKLKELQDWKNFAVTPKRGELIEQMQALIGVDEDPVQLAEQIKRLQEEWRSLAKGSTDTEEDWTKFHEASQAAYQPCREHFETQAKQREENLQKRKALVARLKSYEASTDWQHVEWKHVANAVRSAKQEWRECGPTDRGATKPLEKAFDALIDKVEARLTSEYNANLERKQGLIQQARRLEGTQDLAQAANDVKRLQTAWREIGLTPHAEGQRLWEEFKQLCDAVFDKRRQVHNERISGLKQTEVQAVALCVEAEELAGRADAEVFAGGQRIRELREAFYALGDLPRESAQSIQRRFKRALERFDAAVAKQRQREADVAWDNLFAAADRVRLHQLEGTESAADVRSYIETLKHWPKGGAQAIERKLAQAPSNPAANEAALRVLAIRAEVATGLTTPESDQTQRRMMQLQALVNGTGRTTATPKEQLEALAFEWVAVGAAPTEAHTALFARFRQAWEASRR